MVIASPLSEAARAIMASRGQRCLSLPRPRRMARLSHRAMRSGASSSIMDVIEVLSIYFFALRLIGRVKLEDAGCFGRPAIHHPEIERVEPVL